MNMLKWLKDLLSAPRIKQLEKEIEELRAKVVEKQQHIDKTNAYWKKKLYQKTHKSGQ